MKTEIAEQYPLFKEYDFAIHLTGSGGGGIWDWSFTSQRPVTWHVCPSEHPQKEHFPTRFSSPQ